MSKERINSCFVMTGLVFCRRCSAVKHFVPPNNRILQSQIRNLELSEVQIKSASRGDSKKKRKEKAERGMKFDKVSSALVRKS